MTKAIFPGTFNPITNGHINIAYRAVNIFDEVIIAISEKRNEELLLTANERLILINEVFSNTKNIRTIIFNGLVTDLARDESAKFIVRGVRTLIDFDYELKMADMNKKLYCDIETIFLTPEEGFNNISSSLVREISASGGDVSSFVPPVVQQALKDKL